MGFDMSLLLTHYRCRINPAPVGKRGMNCPALARGALRCGASLLLELGDLLLVFLRVLLGVLAQDEPPGDGHAGSQMDVVTFGIAVAPSRPNARPKRLLFRA